MQTDTEEGRDNQSAEFVWLQPYVWAKIDIINQSQGVSACSFGGSLGAVAVRSCLFFSPWTGIGVWKVNWATWGQKQISNVIIESKCGFIEANLIGPYWFKQFYVRPIKSKLYYRCIIAHEEPAPGEIGRKLCLFSLSSFSSTHSLPLHFFSIHLQFET